MSDRDWIELRPDDSPPKGHDGYPAMDEIVAKNVDIHFERMDKDHVWVGIYKAGSNERIVVSLRARGGRLYFGAEED